MARDKKKKRKILSPPEERAACEAGGEKGSFLEDSPWMNFIRTKSYLS